MTMKQQEKTLLQALQRGEPHACDEMIQRYSGKIYNVALRLTGHPNEAEEVLQETFINACRGVSTFEGRASLQTWLYRIATNNGLMRLRRKKPPTLSLDVSVTGKNDESPRELSDWYWDPESLVLSEELRQAMDDAVAQLPETLHSVFVLRDVEGFSTKETAEILNISVSSAKVRLHRARLFLREQLAAYFSNFQKEQTAS